MRTNVNELARIYVNARRILALDAVNQSAVRTGKLFGAKRDCRTLEAVFPQLAKLSFSCNVETPRWDVNYGDKGCRQHLFSFAGAPPAVQYAQKLIRDQFNPAQEE